MTTGVIAFSGGLDTSFLVPFVREEYGITRVVTVTVDTGGFSKDDEARIAARAREVGSDEHHFFEASQAFYGEIIRFLIFGNVSRDGYPLCVGSERLIQAKEALRIARQTGADVFFHGSTGAGNDQYRFDLVAHVLGQSGAVGLNRAIEVKAPVREHGVTRARSSEYLRARGIKVEEKTTSYSYNVGLWGVSIGGKETLTASGLIPEDVWWSKPDPSLSAAELAIDFEQGEPVRLVSPLGNADGPVAVIRALALIGNRLAVGRHYHVGTSVPGKKGRLAYESPAADILYEAHRMIERLVMTQLQITFKRAVGEELGRLVHEAKIFDPLLDDLKAYLVSSQRRVTGTARVHLAPGRIAAVTVETPFDLLAAEGATYGEASSAYSGADAAGATKLHAFEQKLYRALARE